MGEVRATAENNVPQDAPLRRLVVLSCAIALVAGAFALVVPLWMSERGVVGPLLVDSERPVLSGLAALRAFVFATLVAIVVSRVVNTAVGTFVLGAGVGYLALRSGSAIDFAFGASRLVPAAVEIAGWSVLIAAASWALYRFGGRLPDFPLTGDDEIDSPTGPLARRSWFAAALAVAVAWLVAANDTKGQAIAAVVIGSFVAAFVARSLAKATQPVYLPAIIVLGFAIVSGFLAFAARGDLATGFVDGSFPRLLRLMPVDIAAGTLVGSAMGFGFARGFVSPTE